MREEGGEKDLRKRERERDMHSPRERESLSENPCRGRATDNERGREGARREGER